MVDPERHAIAEALDEHGPATGPELAALLDAHPAAVERQCRMLQQRGRVRQVTGGMYALADEGGFQPPTASD